MYDTPQDDHNHAGMLSHDFPSILCPGGCGWPFSNCHCS